ncbi:ATP-binding protein [Streptomyces sp. NBC_00726]|uniref:ATP-binding protein n=1 Tax=Streptomyces sp. NBC_00726 TaxID=2903674 RepID=UPI0038691187
MTVTATPRPTGHPGYSETLPCAKKSALTARRLVLTALTVWGQDRLIDDAELIVSEMVANAVQHTRSRLILVRVSYYTAHVQIAVVDKSRSAPLLTVADNDDVQGRGLALIDALATQWGCDLLPWGKRVWADLKCEETQ